MTPRYRKIFQKLFGRFIKSNWLSFTVRRKRAGRGLLLNFRNVIEKLAFCCLRSNPAVMLDKYMGGNAGRQMDK
jgi:hypothetical protein